MRKKLIYTLLLTLGVSIFGSIIPTNAIGELQKYENNISLFKSYGTTGNDYIADMIKTKDGGFMIGANSYSSNSTYQIEIEKYDTDENLEWSKVLDGSATDYVYDVTELELGGYVIVGKTSSKDGDFTNGDDKLYNEDGYIIKLSEDGEVMNYIRYVGAYSDSIDDVVSSPDGGFVIFGATKSKNLQGIPNTTENSTSYNFVRKYDKDFNILWTYTTLNKYKMLAMDIDSQGNIYASSTTSGKSTVYKIDNAGLASTVKSDIEGEITSINVVSDSNILYTSYVSGSKSTVALVGKTFGNYSSLEVSDSSLKFNNVIKVNSNKYIAIGDSKSTIPENGSSKNTIIYELNGSLKLVEKYSFGGTVQESPSNNIIAFNEENFIFSVSSKSSDIKGIDYTNAGGTDGLIAEVNKRALAIKPTPTMLEDGTIQINDYNSDSTRKDLFYRINYTGADINEGWIKYTAPITPEYDSNGNYKLETKSINTYDSESGIQVYTLSKAVSGTENPDGQLTEGNLDSMFNKKDTLKLELSTNTVEFGDVSGLLESEQKDTVVTKVSSSASWDMTIRALDDFKGEKNPENVMTADNLEVKIDDNEYKEMSKSDITLLEGQPVGENIENNIKFKLKSTAGVKADKYTIPTEVKITQR